MNEQFFKITIAVPEDKLEEVYALLYQLGVSAGSEEIEKDGKLRIDAYITASGNTREQLQLSLYDPLKRLNIKDVAIDLDEEKDWSKNWRQWFKPFQIVPKVVITPSWENYIAAAGESVITIDPKMAFGTGLHETTKLCAEAIYKLAQRCKIQSMLDVGTGSGILILVAGKLGIIHSTGVENDPDAKTVAVENLLQNKMSGIEIFNALDEVKGKFDLVISNILLNTNIELKSALIKKLGEHGQLILSGITNEQEAELAKRFCPPLKLVETTRQNEWSCVLLSKE